MTDAKSDGVEKENGVNQTKRGRGACFWIVIITIIIMVLILATAAILEIRSNSFSATANRIIDEKLSGMSAVSSSSTASTKSTSSSPAASTTAASSEKVDSKIIGHWDTGCLVPDANSPWAERHEFTIGSDGSAVHQRWSGDSCAGLQKDTPQQYKISIPNAGQIDLVGVGETESIYDIYKVEGDTLYFGHGFCNCNTISTFVGASEANRITIINSFLAYKKN